MIKKDLTKKLEANWKTKFLRNQITFYLFGKNTEHSWQPFAINLDTFDERTIFQNLRILNFFQQL